MKLAALHIEQFGVWHDRNLSELDPGLNVWFGRNEAGKTTLLDFTRGMLFGFTTRRQRYLSETPSATIGGTLELLDGAQRLRCERQRTVGPDRGVRETCRLLDASQQLQPETRWNALLSHVDEATFERVFAVGLREVQELGTLTDSQAGALLYELSCGAAGRVVINALNDVRQTRHDLLNDDPNSSRIGQLQIEKRKLQARLASLRAEIAQYGRQIDEGAELEQRIAHLQRDLGEWRAERRRLETAVSMSDNWQALSVLPLPVLEAGTLTPDALLRFEDLTIRGRRLQRRIRSGRKLWAQQPAPAMVPRPAGLGEESARRRATLFEQREMIGLWEQQLDELREESRRLQPAPAMPQPLLTKGPTPLEPHVIRRLRPAARRLSEARRAREQSQQEAESLRQQHSGLADSLKRQLQGRSSADVAKAIENAGQSVNHARRRLQLDERLTRMQRQRGDLEEQTRELLDRQVLGYWTLGWLGGLFILGVVLILSALFLPPSLTGGLGWWLAGFGAVGILAAIASRFVMEQSAENQMEACQAQMHLLARQIDQSQRERDSLDAQLPADGGPITRRVDTAEEELARYEGLLPLEGRVRQADEAAQLAHTRAEQARAAAEATERAWRDGLRTAGLSQDMSPQEVRTLLQHEPVAPAANHNAERLHRLEAEIAVRQRSLEHWTGRIRQALVDARIATPDKSLTAQLDQLAVVHREQVARDEAERKALRARRRLRLRLRRAARRFSRIATERRHLMLTAGVSTPEEFRQIAAHRVETARRASQREQLRQRMVAACAGVAPLDAIERLLQSSSAAELSKHISLLADRIASSERELTDLQARQHRLTGDPCSSASELHTARLELSMISERLREAWQRWRIASLTETALAAQLQRYEREHQPVTLRQASEYFERLTEGRYRRVWTPLDREATGAAPSTERRLLVESADGRSQPAPSLSRGTREQLFLSLRLAVVADYRRRGFELPLVLDDVLVNFDDARARRAAEVLRDFAQAGHQVFVLTCHEHIARAFHELEVPIHDLTSGNRWSQASKPVPRVEMPPQLPSQAPREMPLIEVPQREPARRIPMTRRRERRAAAVVERPIVESAVLDRPVLRMPLPLLPPLPHLPVLSPPPREFTMPLRRRWYQLADPNGAEDFAGEFTERVFS